MKGFKEFLFQGDVLDLAVALVIGTAFAAVVKEFVSAIITPLLNCFSSKKSQGWGFHLKSGQDNTFVNLSNIVNALLTFLITAALVYFVLVLPYKKFRERRGTTPVAEPTETELLAEIRDALVAGRR